MSVLSDEQLHAIELVESGASVFITGVAGTGKSLIVRYLMDKVLTKDAHVTSSTGKTAVAIGGTTIHSWSGMGIGDKTAAQLLQRQSRETCKRLKDAKALVLDEISMISAPYLDLLDEYLRLTRRKPQPFGGVQVVVTGDFLQLPPVSRSGSPKFAFEAECWPHFRVAELTKSYRQETDGVFLDALNEIRMGGRSDSLKDVFARCMNRVFDTSDGIEPIELFARRKEASDRNDVALAKLAGDTVEFLALDSGDIRIKEQIDKDCMAPKVLKLKIGAQVVLLYNKNVEVGLCNGTQGVVTGFGVVTGEPRVRFTTGDEILIQKHRWEVKSGSRMALREQIPLMLAYSFTIHKGQGMTLSRVKVHLDDAFECSQVYVALSRAQSRDGLSIQGKVFPLSKIKVHPSAVEFYEELRQSAPC